MSEFWETFEAGADAAIDEMGEDAILGGETVKVVVQEWLTRPQIVGGGLSSGLAGKLHVSQAVGAALADGAEVTCRGLTGRVINKEPLGGGWVVTIGPENRYAGDEEF